MLNKIKNFFGKITNRFSKRKIIVLSLSLLMIVALAGVVIFKTSIFADTGTGAFTFTSDTTKFDIYNVQVGSDIRLLSSGATTSTPQTKTPTLGTVKSGYSGWTRYGSTASFASVLNDTNTSTYLKATATASELWFPFSTSPGIPTDATVNSITATTTLSANSTDGYVLFASKDASGNPARSSLMSVPFFSNCAGGTKDNTITTLASGGISPAAVNSLFIGLLPNSTSAQTCSGSMMVNKLTVQINYTTTTGLKYSTTGTISPKGNYWINSTFKDAKWTTVTINGAHNVPSGTSAKVQVCASNNLDFSTPTCSGIVTLPTLTDANPTYQVTLPTSPVATGMYARIKLTLNSNSTFTATPILSTSYTGGFTYTPVAPPVTTYPTITSITPSSGPAGTAVAIAGSNFGTVKNALNFIDSTGAPSFSVPQADITSWTTTSIQAKTPATLVLSKKYKAQVIVSTGGSATSTATFTVTAGTVPPTTTCPTITNVAPTSFSPKANPPTQITITGTGLVGSKFYLRPVSGTSVELTFTGPTDTKVVAAAPAATLPGAYNLSAEETGCTSFQYPTVITALENRWTGNGATNNWDDAGNWLSNDWPKLATDKAYFPGADATFTKGNKNVIVNIPVKISQLVIDKTYWTTDKYATTGLIDVRNRLEVMYFTQDGGATTDLAGINNPVKVSAKNAPFIVYGFKLWGGIFEAPEGDCLTDATEGKCLYLNNIASGTVFEITSRAYFINSPNSEVMIPLKTNFSPQFKISANPSNTTNPNNAFNNLSIYKLAASTADSTATFTSASTIYVNNLLAIANPSTNYFKLNLDFPNIEAGSVNFSGSRPVFFGKADKSSWLFLRKDFVNDIGMLDLNFRANLELIDKSAVSKISNQTIFNEQFKVATPGKTVEFQSDRANIVHGAFTVQGGAGEENFITIKGSTAHMCLESGQVCGWSLYDTFIPSDDCAQWAISTPVATASVKNAIISDSYYVPFDTNNDGIINEPDELFLIAEYAKDLCNNSHWYIATGSKLNP